MSVLGVLFLAIQFSVTYGRLTVLRTTSNPYIRKLMCVSEDDGSGLVWNFGNISPGDFTDFENRNDDDPKSKIDCYLNATNTCFSFWITTGWSLTNSTETPMGPVYDHRWEGFEEHKASSETYNPIRELRKTDSFVISIRGWKDSYMLFCEGEDYTTEFCYFIIIGGWNNTRSVIRKCATGVPKLTVYASGSCANFRDSYMHESLSPFEWRTFLIKWNEITRTISVYDDKSLILTYTDKVNSAKQVPERNTNYTMLVASSSEMLFRLHSYNFLHTTDRKTVLESPEIFLSSTNLCVQMAIGLCAECKLELMLVNPSSGRNEESLEIIKGTTVAGVHGLPMWQYAQINKTISFNLRESVRIKMVPLLDRESPNPLWAVANVRMCPLTGSVRASTMDAREKLNQWKTYASSNITCQKLFYSENTVVSSVPAANPQLEFGDSDCPKGKVGPYCSIDCARDLGLTSECVNAMICEKSGCTCPLGVISKDCEQKCDSKNYGHNCKHTCGQCNNNSCDFRTGVCTEHCDNSKGFKLPPFCKIGIDAPSLPNVEFINETSVRVAVPNKDEYKLVKLDYSFHIKNGNGVLLNNLRSIETNTHLIGFADSLEPGVSYSVACSLYIVDDMISIPGRWKEFTTLCNLNSKFEIERRSRSLTLKIYQQYNSCPVNQYNFVVEELKTKELIDKGVLNSISYDFFNLKPFTFYKVTIYSGSNMYFSREVQTLEAAPSKVRNIKLRKTSNSIMLTWDPPEHENGIIKKYIVVLKVVSYKGCDEHETISAKTIKKFTKFNDIQISDVTPYTTYSLRIAAYTSQRGADSEELFSTDESEIPSEVYGQLKINDYTLRWDPPADCTTITGTMYTRLIFRGLSESVANFTYHAQTAKPYMNLSFLSGAEEYEASVYVIRGYDKPHNSSAFRRINFTTPPKAPPPVSDLNAYEVNAEYYDNLTIHLRWKAPKPPTNGKIKDYIVSLPQRYRKDTVLKTVSPTEYCVLWPEYICTNVTIKTSFRNRIQVSVQNENVSNTGDGISVDIADKFPPDSPKIFHVNALAKGVVNVSWSHPWRTGDRLRRFLITREIISTNLSETNTVSRQTINYEYLVNNYQAMYSVHLYLMPSTTYNLKLIAETIVDTSSAEKFSRVRTPSAMEFKNEPTVEPNNEESTILLHIPTIVNATKNSVMHVIVVSSTPCDHYTKASSLHYQMANIGSYETAWRTATFPAYKFAGKTFTVGDDKLYESAVNCPLKLHQSYSIAIILEPEEGSMNSEIKVAKTLPFHIGEVLQRHTETWLVPIMICLIVAAIGYYLYRRKTKVPSTETNFQQETALPLNTQIPGKKESLNSNRILAVTPDTAHKECLSSVHAPQNSPLTHDRYEDMCTLVEVKNFEDYVKRAIDSGLIDNQFNILPRGQTKPWDYGKLPQNKSKNRYRNLIAYDENRVILEKLPGDPCSDYINANYINGYKKEKCYIATQGPKSNTINDFWRMIWQEQTTVICMLANVVETGKTKCEQYWPNIGKKTKYGELVVFTAKHTVFADYTFRTLHLTHGAETRKIEHLHYTAWPDHDVPFSTHSVVTYLKKLLATSPGNGPVVVHCSAGVGRTGTIILCDICLRRAAAEGELDVFSETEAIRSQRANMVDTKQQYLFAHLILLECLLSIPTCLPCDEALPMKINELKKQLVIQQQSLEKTTWQDEALRPAINQMSLHACNLAKNRFPELASGHTGRVHLKRYPPTDDNSDYISAIYVDGVKLQNQYIATQLPLPGTLGDFWRMVNEYKVELIVQLQPPDPDDKTCCSIVPSSEFQPVPYINIKKKECTEYEYYTLQKLTLDSKMAKPATEQEVTIICLTEWKAGRNQAPPPTTALITLWQATERIARGRELTVVMCHDGVTGCGLYLALSVLLERMSVERECDVCLAIRAVRRSNRDFVRSLDQMEYLYDAANTYLKYFETYANLNDPVVNRSIYRAN